MIDQYNWLVYFNREEKVHFESWTMLVQFITLTKNYICAIKKTKVWMNLGEKTGVTRSEEDMLSSRQKWPPWSNIINHCTTSMSTQACSQHPSFPAEIPALKGSVSALGETWDINCWSEFELKVWWWAYNLIQWLYETELESLYHFLQIIAWFTSVLGLPKSWIRATKKRNPQLADSQTLYGGNMSWHSHHVVTKETSLCALFVPHPSQFFACTFKYMNCSEILSSQVIIMWWPNGWISNCWNSFERFKKIDNGVFPKCFLSNQCIQWQIFVIKMAWICHLFCKRLCWCMWEIASLNSVQFMLQIPWIWWIYWIHWKFCSI